MKKVKSKSEERRIKIQKEVRQLTAKDKLEIMIFAEKLAPIYDLFNWKWRDSDESPTAEEIYNCILELVDDISVDGGCSTGGISVSFDKEFETINITWSLEKNLYL